MTQFPDSISLSNSDSEQISALDACGFLVAPGESPDNYRRRVAQLRRNCAEVAALPDDGAQLSSLVGFRLGHVEPLSAEIMEEAAALTEPLFGFRADWAPAYFPRKGLGALWGGCTVETDKGVPVFFLRRSFSNRRKWFLYGRDELLAHELCHSVRAPLKDDNYEEQFAYMTSSGRFRRKAGTFFRSEWDAILFLAPVFVLLIAQLLVFSGVVRMPLYPFWILIFLYPLYLICRNVPDELAFQRAGRKLKRAGFTNPHAALFRMISPEIHLIANMKDADLPAYFRKRHAGELRWQVILARFQPDTTYTEGDLP